MLSNMHLVCFISYCCVVFSTILLLGHIFLRDDLCFSNLHRVLFHFIIDTQSIHYFVYNAEFVSFH